MSKSLEKSRRARVVVHATSVTSITLLLTSLVTSCATNPVTGRRELSLVSESQEIQMGREASQNDVRRVGALSGTPAEALVKRIGTKMAAGSERPNLPWEFHLLDDAAVNAFAYPGGFIFVTRGLMTHLNSEAELAEVIGHEIGHVTAKHSVAQMSQAQLAQIGLVGASIFSSTVAKYGDVLGAGTSLLFLKFGRDDELQSDALGFKYSLTDKYDVRESPKVFTTLGRLSGGAGRIPEWQSTHPDPGNRVQRAEQRIAQTPPAQLQGLTVNRDSYLKLLDGMVFGENPREGYFKGTRFLHPELRFQLDFPTGWRTANQPDAVIAQSPDQSAQLVLQGAQGTPAQVVQQFTQQQGITLKQSSQSSINGLTSAQASFDAQTEQGVINGLVIAISHQNATYMLLGLSAPAATAQRGPEMETAMRSFRPVTDNAVLSVQPARIKLITLTRQMTGQQFVQSYPSSIPAEQVYIINGIDASTSVAAGTILKQVVGGTLP
ncbi:MAG: M48 family metalloprotease [Gemmatimonadaceae bacterium]|nr:M48 family metalloprotease [Gemmatimonadaceae bacterium]